MTTILICGCRDWNDETPIRNILEQLPKNTIIIHGNCRGADKLASKIAEELGFAVKSFPANWDLYGLSAGHIRNQQMLDEGQPDEVIAFHSDIENSKGTRNMVARAKKQNIPTLVIDK